MIYLYIAIGTFGEPFGKSMKNLSNHGLFVFLFMVMIMIGIAPNIGDKTNYIHGYLLYQSLY